MPFYSFHCEQCKEVFEIRASIREKEAGLKPDCPKCGSNKTHQLITAGLVIRRGATAGLSSSSCGPDAGPGCC